jgi:hypothetical protein
MRAALLACVAALPALAACRTGRHPEAVEVAPAAPDVPAQIVSPTAESRAALRRAVSEALRGAPVTLADDALTRTSSLVIEPAWPRDAGGRLLGGREYGLPERFRLVLSGGRCVLVHEGNGERLTLEATSCSPAISR